jgi:hypothetical protein
MLRGAVAAYIGTQNLLLIKSSAEAIQSDVT